ncbi:MAG: hypothetical protein ACM3WU_04275 [Bacillota bacterium]
MRLYEAIKHVTAERFMTYSEITQRINETRAYVPSDGLFVAQANVRDAVRRHPELFEIDRSTNPHRLRAIRPRS